MYKYRCCRPHVWNRQQPAFVRLIAEAVVCTCKNQLIPDATLVFGRVPGTSAAVMQEPRRVPPANSVPVTGMLGAGGWGVGASVLGGSYGNSVCFSHLSPVTQLWQQCFSHLSPVTRLWQQCFSHLSPVTRLWQQCFSHLSPVTRLWQQCFSHLSPVTRLWQQCLFQSLVVSSDSVMATGFVLVRCCLQ